MTDYTLTIPGKPMAKQRAKHGKGYTYTPEKTVIYENLVKKCYMDEYGQTMLEGEISAEIKAFFEIPKSRSKADKHKMTCGIINPTGRPDADNIAKSVLDALNGVAYRDDSAVVKLSVEKRYSDRPRVELVIKANK